MGARIEDSEQPSNAIPSMKLVRYADRSKNEIPNY